MLLLTSTSDLVRVVTGQAADIEVHADWADVTGTPAVVSMGRTNTASITTATTTTVVGSPAASTSRNVKALYIFNNHASVSTTVAVEHTDGTTAERMAFATLLAGESLSFIEGAGFVHLDPNGIPRTVPLKVEGLAITAQIASHSADTYYGIPFDITSRVQAGSWFKWRARGLSKTAGTAAPVFTIRVGTAGAVGDTSRAAITLGAQTAVVDQGGFELIATFRSVGSGTSAVIRADVALEHNLLITGFATTPAGLSVGGNTGGGFDSTVAGTKIGLSVNPGTSGAWVVETFVLEVGNLIP